MVRPATVIAYIVLAAASTLAAVPLPALSSRAVEHGLHRRAAAAQRTTRPGSPLALTDYEWKVAGAMSTRSWYVWQCICDATRKVRQTKPELQLSLHSRGRAPHPYSLRPPIASCHLLFLFD
jgi:hypothetical protein